MFTLKFGNRIVMRDIFHTNYDKINLGDIVESSISGNSSRISADTTRDYRMIIRGHFDLSSEAAFLNSSIQAIILKNPDGSSLLRISNFSSLDVGTLVSVGDALDLITSDVSAGVKLIGSNFSDVLTGYIGNDKILGGNGNDRLKGDTGDDLLYGQNGNDKLLGQDGDDTLYGGNQNDLLKGQNGDDRLYGQSGDDRLYGQDGNDLLYGQGGNDRLYGLGGDDRLNGGSQNDRLYGGDGNDYLDGKSGNDWLLGQGGDDTLVFNAADTLRVRGGSGIDTLEVTGSGVKINLTAINDGKQVIRGIEIIDLEGSGNNTLKLNIHDVLALPDGPDAFFSDGTTQLLVKGDAGDVVNSAGQGWVQGTDTDIGGISYTPYTHASISAQLLVETDITQNIS